MAPPTLSRRPILAPLTVLAASLLLTAAARSSSTARGRDTARFEHHAQSTQDQIAAHLDSDTTLLSGAAGFFAASKGVTREEFHLYVERLGLKHHEPGVQGLGFSLLILASEKEAVIEQQRASGLPSFHIWPEGPRAEYHAII